MAMRRWNKVTGLLHNQNFRNGSIFTFFMFLNRGLNFLLLIVLSWYILPDSYGKLNLFYTCVNVVTVLICLCTNGIIGINYFKVKKEILSQYINVILSCTFAVSIVLFSASLFFHSYIAKVAGIDYKLQFLCIYVCAAAIVYHLLTDIYRLEEKTFAYGLVTTISTLLNIAATLFLVIVLNQDWLGRIYANLFATTIFLFVGVYLLIRKGFLRCLLPTKQQYKESLAYGVPLIPHCMNGFLRQGVDRYIINGFFTTTQVGLFSFSTNFSFLIYSIGSAFNQSNSVYIFKCLSVDPEGSKKKLRKQTFMMIGFFAAITILLNIICLIIFPIVFPKYNDAIVFLFPLSMGAFFQCIYLQFCNYLFYYRKTKELMYMTFSVSIIHIALSLWLTQYSAVLTAYVSMISSAIEAFLVFLYSRRLYKVI